MSIEVGRDRHGLFIGAVVDCFAEPKKYVRPVSLRGTLNTISGMYSAWRWAEKPDLRVMKSPQKC